MRSLAKRPVDRYQTGDLRRALDSLDQAGAPRRCPTTSRSRRRRRRLPCGPKRRRRNRSHRPPVRIRRRRWCSADRISPSRADSERCCWSSSVAGVGGAPTSRAAPVPDLTVPAPSLARTRRLPRPRSRPRLQRRAASREGAGAGVAPPVVAPRPPETPPPHHVPPPSSRRQRHRHRLRCATARVAARPATSRRRAEGEFEPVVVRDLRAVAVIDGRTSRVVESIVAFSERSIRRAAIRATGPPSRPFPTVRSRTRPSPDRASRAAPAAPPSTCPAESPRGTSSREARGCGRRSRPPTIAWCCASSRSRSGRSRKYRGAAHEGPDRALHGPGEALEISSIPSHLPRIHPVLGIERPLDRAHHVERRAVLRSRYFILPMPTPCSPVQVPPIASARITIRSLSRRASSSSARARGSST